jgi:O-antigen/teichoic acid export membrane protein
MTGTAGQPERVERRTLLVTIAKFAGGNLVGNALTILSGLLLARYVGPEVLGLFASLALVQGYAPWLLLGTGNGLGREVPYALGQGNRDRAQALVAAAGSWTLRVAGVCAAALLGVAVTQAWQGRWDLAFGWTVQAVTVWGLLFCANYLQFTYRTAGDFTRLSQIQVTQGVVGLVGVALAALLGFFGLCLRALLLALAQMAQLWHWRPFRVRPAWSAPDLVHLMKVGLPIMFVGQLSVWWGTLNDTLVLAHLDHVQLGLNAVVVLGTRPFQILIRAVASVVYPQMTQEFARTGDLRQALRVAALPAFILLPLMVVLVAAGWWLMPRVIPPLLPKYAAAVPALQWNLLALIPYSLNSFNNIFAASGRMTPYAAAMVGGVLAYLGALYLLPGMRQDLVGFAQAMVIGRTFYLLLSFTFIGMLVSRSPRAATPASAPPAE